MSFFLLPPVSYQTQQKLKANAERKKSKSRSHKLSLSSHSIRLQRQNSVVSLRSSIKSTSTCIKKTDSINPAIDELPNLDSLLISSSNSDIRKPKLNTFNYNYHSDINDIIGHKSHRRHTKSRHNSYTEITSDYSPSVYPASQYSTYASSDHDSIAVVNPNYKMEFKEVEDDSYKNSMEFQLSEDEDEEAETNKLTRVYSDVDSIFSTKVESTPRKKGIFQ